MTDIAERIRIKFQLTAARRRLVQAILNGLNIHYFNSQPREGGWTQAPTMIDPFVRFQLTAARRRLALPFSH